MRCDTMNAARPAIRPSAAASIGRVSAAPNRPRPTVPQPSRPLVQHRPGSLPTLIPFAVIALLLAIILVGFVVFPAVKTLINQQDCVASGRSDCYPRP